MTHTTMSIETDAQFELPIAQGPWIEEWVGYGRARYVLETLKSLLEREPSMRPQNIVLYGDTNNGKTMLAQTFRDKTNKKYRDEGGKSDEKLVLYAQTPPEGDIRTLLWLILRELDVIAPVNGSVSKHLAQLLHVIPKARTKMIILDEVHNVLAASRNRQETFLQTLKFFSNELRIPIICIGTVEVLRAIQTNQQNGNRFESMQLSRWNYGKGFIAFAGRLAQSMGIDHKEFFRDAKFTASLHRMSEGLTGELRRILAIAICKAQEDGKNQFEPYMFESIKWTPPSERRQNVDSAIR